MLNEFYCEVREECLPLEVRCDGVLDCYSNEELFETDESNCDGQWLLISTNAASSHLLCIYDQLNCLPLSSM